MPDNDRSGDGLVKPKATPIPNDDRNKIKTLDDLALSEITLEHFPVVKEWRRRLFDSKYLPEICDELPGHLTEYMQKEEAREFTPQKRRANALHHVFTKKTPIVKLPIEETDALLPGQTTTSFVGPVVYPDAIGYCIWPELNTVADRSQNPFKIKPAVASKLNKEIFPYWLERRTVQEEARYSAYDTDDFKGEDRDRVEGVAGVDPPLKKGAGETPKCQEVFERVAFFLSDKATCVSHTVPDFERMLKYGLNALAARMQSDIDDGLADTPEQVEFLEGVIKVFDGATTYAGRLAEEAEKAGNAELASLCRKVPAGPSETLHEAVAAIWICYHLLLQENTNFGFSIGRLDQLLNSYYLSDWEKLGSQAERDAYTNRAVELICHFFLRCSDHVPLSTEGSEKLFAGSGSNQALTVGGANYEKGELVDAVNDMTYIILKATELLSIRDPNVHARYHKDVHHRDPQGNKLPPGVTSSYLKRLCQVNIVTRATPAIHGDAPVAESMARYYAAHEGIDMEEALQDAHDYASIGCIEQNSAGKHYGNTGSTLMVLPAVLELTIFGGKHRSDGVKEKSPNLFYGETSFTTRPLWQMADMDEFIAAFRFQMDEMARHTVMNNNYFGRTTERVRPVPFLSGLFTGPTNTPGGSGATFRDLAAGGAKYNSSGVAVIGLADVIDAFCVIDELVFGGKMTADELLAAMDGDFDEKALPQQVRENPWGSLTLNWESLAHKMKALFEKDSEEEGHHLEVERMREVREAIRKAPKYGAGVAESGIYDNSTALKYTNLITGIVQDVYFQYRTHRGGRYLPGYWSMTNHAGFGMLSKATPNGRKKGAPFASGITPCPGLVKRNGDPVMILDHILSVAEVDANTVQNGYTYNLSLTTRGQSHFDDDTALFARYMKTFEDEDGVLVQLCVTPIKAFKKAHRAATAAEEDGAGEGARKALDPYRDLMIRVAGYSAYFVTLSPEMRQEIIDRANFALETGREQHSL
ncbi:MAG: pyruvate formate lyase family protein [Thermodesulfobacteriota bacterium]